MDIKLKTRFQKHFIKGKTFIDFISQIYSLGWDSNFEFDKFRHLVYLGENQLFEIYNDLWL